MCILSVYGCMTNDWLGEWVLFCVSVYVCMYVLFGYINVRIGMYCVYSSLSSICDCIVCDCVYEYVLLFIKASVCILSVCECVSFKWAYE